mmetsp:Transcript_128528/g.357806  ORF Transcript_128528/g.357806 Transcript_128528/m.357806 type:complete len:490 (+) Transcript_128528:392-1861(+)
MEEDANYVGFAISSNNAPENLRGLCCDVRVPPERHDVSCAYAHGHQSVPQAQSAECIALPVRHQHELQHRQRPDHHWEPAERAHCQYQRGDQLCRLHAGDADAHARRAVPEHHRPGDMVQVGLGLRVCRRRVRRDAAPARRPLRGQRRPHHGGHRVDVGRLLRGRWRRWQAQRVPPQRVPGHGGGLRRGDVCGLGPGPLNGRRGAGHGLRPHGREGAPQAPFRERRLAHGDGLRRERHRPHYPDPLFRPVRAGRRHSRHGRASEGVLRRPRRLRVALGLIPSLHLLVLDHGDVPVERDQQRARHPDAAAAAVRPARGEAGLADLRLGRHGVGEPDDAGQCCKPHCSAWGGEHGGDQLHRHERGQVLHSAHAHGVSCGRDAPAPAAAALGVDAVGGGRHCGRRACAGVQGRLPQPRHVAEGGTEAEQQRGQRAAESQGRRRGQHAGRVAGGFGCGKLGATTLTSASSGLQCCCLSHSNCREAHSELWPML